MDVTKKNMMMKRHHIHKRWERGCQFDYFESCESPTTFVKSEVLATLIDEAILRKQVCPHSNKK